MKRFTCSGNAAVLLYSYEGGLDLRRVSDLSPGERGSVRQVNGGGAIRQRLLDMGILPDVLIEVERVAPAGDPLWIKSQGLQLSLRRAEADAVIVECD